MRLLLLCLLLLSVDCATHNQLKMKVLNHAGEPVQLFWIDTFKANASLVSQTKKPIRNNSHASINTFEGHQFAVQLLKQPDTNVTFVMGAEDATLVVTQSEAGDKLSVEKLDPRQDFLQVIDEKRAICRQNSSDNEQFNKCVTAALVEEMVRIQESQRKIEEFRDRMAARLRNYTCADPDMETTEPIRTTNYRFLDKTYKVDMYLDTPTAKIWSVRDFVTESECERLIETARPNLVKATVSDESDGSSTFSENRKAQQAGYEFDENMREDGLWPLYDRVIKMVNHQAEMSLQPEGQEGFTVIQYNVGDEYTPHCDGTCDGSYVLPGARVATSVLYCKVPEQGGATSFTNANVFVRPEPLMATFFTYKSFDGQFDSGLTQHSGCPVVEGEKWIATAWLRDGVSSSNPWHRYDPSGVVILESMDESNSMTDGDNEQPEISTPAHEEF